MLVHILGAKCIQTSVYICIAISTPTATCKLTIHKFPILSGLRAISWCILSTIAEAHDHIILLPVIRLHQHNVPVVYADSTKSAIQGANSLFLYIKGITILWLSNSLITNLVHTASSLRNPLISASLSWSCCSIAVFWTCIEWENDECVHWRYSWVCTCTQWNVFILYVDLVLVYVDSYTPTLWNVFINMLLQMSVDLEMYPHICV